MAQVYRLNSSLSTRDSDQNFITNDDVNGYVSAGTEFEIISSKILASGSKALEIKIIKPGPNSQIPKFYSGPIYIYQNKKTEFDTVSNPTLIEAAAPCADGSCNTSVPQEQMKSQQVVKIAQDLVSAIETQASVPVIPPTTAPTVNIESDSINEKIQNYSNSFQVEKMIKWTMRNIQRRSGGGLCYKLTKNSLAAGGLIESHYSDQYARDAVVTLTERGFINLNSKPYDLKFTPETAPKGAVLVYRSSVKCDNSRKTGRTMATGCGHIEIKLGDGSKTKGFKYSSDYKNEESILDGASGFKYELIGVMIKPELSKVKK